MTILVDQVDSVYTKKYKVNVITNSSNFIDSTLSFKADLNNTKVYKSDEGFVLTSNSERIGGGYREGPYSAINQTVKEGYLLNQDRGTYSNKLFRDLEKLGILVPKLDVFLKKYAPYMIQVSKDYVSKDTKYLKFKVTDTEVISSLESATYNDDSIKGTYLAFLFKKDREVVKVNNRMQLTINDLINIPSGYYNVFPKEESLQVKRYNVKDHVEVFVKSFIRVDCSHNVKINNWLTTFSYLYPNSTTKLVLDKDCLSPISGLKDIDRTNTYILYELRNSNYVPVAVLSENGVDDTEIKKLLNSHEEFLRPYKVLPKQVSILLNTDPLSKDSVFKIENEKFDEIKEKAIQELNIPNINIKTL